MSSTNLWVIMRDDDGAFVCPPGSERSYTHSLRQAQTFVHKETAKRLCCGNERVVALSDLMRAPT